MKDISRLPLTTSFRVEKDTNTKYLNNTSALRYWTKRLTNMGNLLDRPIKDKDTHYFPDLAGMEVGSSGMQGWRLEQEDAHVSVTMTKAPDHVLVGVFDGHGGAGASAWAAEHIQGFVEATKSWKDYVEGGASNKELLSDALRQSFLDADAALRVHQETGGVGADTSGCTAVCCMITPNMIICANAGDSRAIIATDGKMKEMSFDHKPYNQLERARIEKAGGSVEFKRVDGDLAVSRAFGDFQYKTSPELPPEQQKVSPEPDLIVHGRSDVDEFLLLACDGLWDVMSNTEAAENGRLIFSEGESHMGLAAEEMVDLSLEKGSRDNISAVLVKLPGIKISPSGSGVAARQAVRQANEKAAEERERGTGNAPRL